MPELPQDEDARFALLFRGAVAPVADEGFSERVVRRVRIRAWQRRLVLATAGATGVAIAWPSIWNLAGALSRQLVVRSDQLAVLGGDLAVRWPELAALLQGRPALYLGVLVLVVPGALRWLDD
jgi:hypothetical protein